MPPENPVLGIVMLNTSFPRLVGDIGNPDTWPFEARYRRVEAAWVSEVVQSELPTSGIIADIREAINELVEGGADAIATSCGFLGCLQEDIQRDLPIPFMSSALLWLPELRGKFGDEATFGILTFDSRKLGPLHFGAGGHDDCEIEGIETGQELHRVVAGNLRELDQEKARQDVLAATQRLLSRALNLSALVLECTNMSPYIKAIEDESRLPVFDINSLILRHLKR